MKTIKKEMSTTDKEIRDYIIKKFNFTKNLKTLMNTQEKYMRRIRKTLVAFFIASWYELSTSILTQSINEYTYIIEMNNIWILYKVKKNGDYVGDGIESSYTTIGSSPHDSVHFLEQFVPTKPHTPLPKEPVHLNDWADALSYLLHLYKKMKTTPKYDIDDTVYYMDENEIQSKHIDGIQIYKKLDKKITIYYNFGCQGEDESHLFPTKQALLDSL